MAKLTIEHTKAASRAMQALPSKLFDGIGAVVVLYNEDGDIAVCSPGGTPIRDVLSYALARELDGDPSQTGIVEPVS